MQIIWFGDDFYQNWYFRDMSTRWIVFLFFVGTLVSCGKEDLSTAAPSLIGDWVHYRAETEFEIIKINADGTGKVQWYIGPSLQRETKEKIWKVKDNRLYLGNVTFNLKPYDIDEYPAVSSSTIIEGYDTLEQGLRYIKLNAQFYTEIE